MGGADLASYRRTCERTVDRVYRKVVEMESIARFISRTKGPLLEALEDPKILASTYRSAPRRIQTEAE